MSGTGKVAAIALIAAAAGAWWSAHESREVTRLNDSLSSASQRIEQLTGSLATAREQMNQTRQQLNDMLDAAQPITPDDAQQSVPAPQPVVFPTSPVQEPASPVEMAQLLPGQSFDLSGSADQVLLLKERH